MAVALITCACMVAAAAASDGPTSSTRSYVNPLTVESTVSPLPPMGGPRGARSRDYRGDPEVLRSGGRYYLYTTSNDSTISFRDDEAGLGVRCFSSDDLIDWKDEGLALDARDRAAAPYTRNMIWSPQVVEARGRFWLFYNAAGEKYEEERRRLWLVGASPYQRLCVAVSDSPTGPFVEHAAPLMDDAAIPGWIDGKRGVVGCIDAFVFREESPAGDPEYTLYWSAIDDETTRNLLWAGRLKPDFTGLLLPPEGPAPRLVLGPPMQDWERDACGGRLILEAPYVFKEDGSYYLLYSANSFNTPNYAMGYATGKTPLGPFRRARNNPLLQSKGVDPRDPDYPVSEETVAGPGSGSLVKSPDGKETFVIYGAIDERTTTPHCANAHGYIRKISLDRLRRGPGGKLKVDGPTRAEPRPLPSGATRPSTPPQQQPAPPER